MGVRQKRNNSAILEVIDKYRETKSMKGGKRMENYFYKCNRCGFVHIVPAYWVSYSPEGTVELEHMDLKTGENCPCTALELLQDDQQ